MSVEIHQPEIEALIDQRMASGSFHDVEEVLIYALKAAPPTETVDLESGLGKKLVKVCAMVNELTDDLDFGRDSSAWRPLDLL